MIGFRERVRDYITGLDQAAFITSPMLYDAALRNLELIGEAATRIPEDVRDARPEILWRTIIGTRDRLNHLYLGIDDDVVWGIARNDVPAPLAPLRELFETAGCD